MSKFIIRIRHSKGMTRFELTNQSSTTIKEVKQLIEEKLNDKPKISTQQLTLNGKSTDISLQNTALLSSLNIKHGDILYLKIVSSAIICESSSTRSSPRIRKRKLNEIESSIQSPPSKRTRLNSNSNSNSHSNTNHNHNHNHNTSSSLVVHTISNTQQSNNSNNLNNNSNNQGGNRLGSGRSLGSARNKNANTKKTEDVKKKLKKKPTSKKKKKKSAKKKDEFLVIKSEGDTIEEIVDNYLNDDNQLNHSLNQLPSNVQSLYCPEARIEAILDVCRLCLSSVSL